MATFEIEIDNETTDGTYLGTVRLLHSPTSQQKVDGLRADMTEFGWVGPPVILAERTENIYALSGTHRLSAVCGLPIAVPAVWLPDDLTDEQWFRIDWTVMDYERFRVFLELATERDEDWGDILAVMKGEL